MPGASWFPGSRVNYAEHILRREGDHPDRTVFPHLSETRPLAEMTWGDLGTKVRILATRLRERGVGPGDRVVSYMPNVPETIIAMLATPLMLLFKGWRGPRWLRKNRRYFGVAAFAYALAHTVFYLVDKATLERIVDELPRLYIWTGWLAFAIFIPLAVTSMDYFLRIMGPRWKSLQRWTYPAAVLTLVHWASLHNWGHPAAALVHFGPLIALEAYRIWYWYLRPRPMRTSGA